MGRTRTARTGTEAKYRAVLAEVESGATVEDVARRHGVRPSTVKWWRWELARRDRQLRHAKEPRLLPVCVVGEATTSRVTTFEVSLPNGLSVRVERAFDEGALTKLITALRAC